MQTSASDNDKIERFISAYNVIEQFLRNELNEGNERGFKYLVSDYQYKYPKLRFLDDLKNLTALRNSLVHGKTAPYQYLSVPISEVVENIERIKERLTNPEMVLPRFQKKVDTVDINDSLFDLLQLINENHYSQFPVYEDNVFKGLITENGITKWLAGATDSINKVNLKEIMIKDMLDKQERRTKSSNALFIKRDTSIEHLINYFSDNISVEAILITHTGKEDQSLLGIVTVSDILDLLDEDLL